MKYIVKIKDIFVGILNTLNPVKSFRLFRRVVHQLNMIQEALGRIESRQISNLSLDQINDAEFRVFSQWGEDGIINYLVHHVPIKNKVFIEFGVENYLQSNTRFLLSNDNWSGLVMDGNSEDIAYLKKDPIYWAHNLKAECKFITKDNIESVLEKNAIKNDVGILSIDIDGNDYWIWEAINCVSPRIVICEYNSLFGPRAKVTTPYRDDFIREKMHHSGVVYGASISALDNLANKKGYKLVASNKAGNNVFFVRDDLLENIRTLSPEEAYQKAQFREYKDRKGNLTFDDFEQRLEKIKEETVFDIEVQKMMQIKDIKKVYD